MSDPLTPEEVLARIPHGAPFRFVDRIHRVDAESIAGACHFREDAPFYAGHYPGHAITPGVLVQEAMAQIGLVGHGIYLQSLRASGNDPARRAFVLTEAEVEFVAPVPPGAVLEVEARPVFFRMGKLRSRVTAQVAGRVVAQGVLGGMGARA